MASGFLFDQVYNPDVLSCLANLSNDEVFTPPEIVNQMLDMLPQELFSNPDTTFLDPACKSGVFLREIAKRLIKGLEPQFPDLQERIDHIFHKQLFGIAITELTSLLSRRSVYCSKYPASEFSVSQFENVDGNVRYKNIPHTWKDKKCIFCGASQGEYDRDSSLETHAYELIHVAKPEEIFSMKFDVIVSNPPYQLSDGGNAASAIPIYHLFVEQALKLKPRYLSMITPARWFTGGRGLDSFRDRMLHDKHIRVIHDYPNASDCFPGVEIKGGVCFFLRDRENAGLCKVYSHDGNNVEITERPLLEEGMDTFIRNDYQISILNKVRLKNEKVFSEYLNAGRYFGFHTRVVWHDKEHGQIQTADGKDNVQMRSTKSLSHSIKVYMHGGVCYMPLSSVPKNTEAVQQWKVLLPRSGNPGTTIIGKPKLSEPQSCSTNTYVVALPPDKSFTETEVKNCLEYICTKFFRFLVSIKTSTQDTPPKAYEFVPVQDFTKVWTDEELYEKYKLTSAEIDHIEKTIKPMEPNGGEEDA